MAIYKVQSGLIFDDRFDFLDSRWFVSPSGSCEVGEWGLRMYHTDETKILFDLPPHPDLMLEVVADYLPTVEGDEGGIVIWQTASDKLEFLESVDNKQGEYSIWRAFKQGNLWTFFAFKDGQWELFDAAFLEANRAGVVLKNPPSDGYTTLDIKQVVLCKGMFLTIGNLGSGNRVDLCNLEGRVVVSQKVQEGRGDVKLFLPALPFRGIVRIYDNGQLISEEEPTDFYGGDVYALGGGIVLMKDGVPLNTYGFNRLGIMQGDKIEQRLQVKNELTHVIENLRISIRQYLGEFGWEWTDLALDKEGDYGKYITIQSIGPGEVKEFWLRVVRDVEKVVFDPTYFIVDIDVGGDVNG